jgi:hypothetical protein
MVLTPRRFPPIKQESKSQFTSPSFRRQIFCKIARSIPRTSQSDSTSRFCDS